MNERPQEAQRLDSESALPLIQGLAHLHESVLLVDAHGRILWISERLGARVGGAEKLRGESWTRLLADPDAACELAARLTSTGRLDREPVVVQGCDETEIAATVSAARLGPHAESCPVVAILRLGDEANRREFENAVEAARPVLETCPDAVVIVDRSRFITYANPAIEHVTGYRPDEILDRPLALFVQSGDDLEQIAAALEPGSPVRSRDLRVRRRDGSGQYVSVSASILSLADGTAAGAVAHLRDVTAERGAEEILSRKNAELEHYVQAVSHDLRSPLVSLLGFTRLLREDYGGILDEKGRHFLDRVETAGRTMETLIHDLLELSRIGRAGEATTRVQPLRVLAQVAAELKPRLDAEGVDLVLPDDAPTLEFDQTRLYQLFSNLLGNALDHMGPGDDRRVDVEFHEEDGDPVIVVRDNGRGIPAEHHERIFEIFQSLAPPGEGRRGTGIGLAVVRKIAETHGGRAWVESEPGRGATFKVRIPTRD